ncbi:precorrin-2 dehydrogenase / sirohydrochlorin ferrochelatase [Fictibacillus solisalsi]|uniref:precorrin-2 dehydrogenase n=1 Tax=Fictibacillus solisalsi TaxID=459525 RepID=A0A1G9XL17_9BACL|nr:NAD(P)-binding protein [Fictibacillus solisalsi]SDM97450.1 precorrin-2 dehydrogenase / sirohydrochlorin ferrochelatase [Fictibacillus solisalsi]
MYPIVLELKGKQAVVVGGGTVAFRKIQGLLETGAFVKVISPEVIDDIKTLHAANKVMWKRKKAEPVDYEHAFIIFAATNNREVNQEVARHAGPFRLVNVVDQPSLGSFTVPAVARRGRLVLSVSTGGASPILAKRIRNDLLAAYPEDYAAYTEFLFYCREKLKKWKASPEEKQKLLHEILNEQYIHSFEKQQAFINTLDQKVT